MPTKVPWESPKGYNTNISAFLCCTSSGNSTNARKICSWPSKSLLKMPSSQILHCPVIFMWWHSLAKAVKLHHHHHHHHHHHPLVCPPNVLTVFVTGCLLDNFQSPHLPLGSTFACAPASRKQENPWSFLHVVLLMEEVLHHLGCIKPCK